LIIETGKPKDTPLHHRTCRIARAKLQTALLKNVDKDRIHVGKKLVDIAHLESGRIRITFRDGFEDEVDLLVGADGIRSVKKSCCSASETSDR
jgi:salicylate hydroxylase